MSHDNDLDSFKKQIVEFLQEQLDQGVKFEDIDLQGYVDQSNRAPQADFNGFSSEQMTNMLYFPFGPECPVQIRRLTDDQVESIPFMRQVLHMMRTLESADLKLTAKGYIPPKIVTELYDLGVHDRDTDWFNNKIEPRVLVVRILRVVLKECGLTKKRHNVMSLTAVGRKLLHDRNELLRAVLKFLFVEYNTGWPDGYNDEATGNVGRLYSLWLLHRYGSEQRHYSFYNEQYIKAFPEVYNTNGRCYHVRVFERLFKFLGLCTVNDTSSDHGPELGQLITKTDLVETIFDFIEP